MSTETPFSDTAKLIRCDVFNKYNEQSVRLIEFDHFRLWEYLMIHKHGAKISNISLCLWVSEGEFNDHESVYTRTGDVEDVTRIIVDLYDEEYGFSNAITRFVRDSEVGTVTSILESHIPEHLRGTDDCKIMSTKGHSITQRQHIEKRPAMLGLED